MNDNGKPSLSPTSLTVKVVIMPTTPELLTRQLEAQAAAILAEPISWAGPIRIVPMLPPA